MLRRAVLLGLVVVVAVPANALADSAVAEFTRDTPVAALDGVLAWSRYDAADGRHHLALRTGGTISDADVKPQERAFDVSLGHDARGRLVALYTRCTPGCDVFRYDVASRRETRIARASSPDLDESWPVQDGDWLAFSRVRDTGKGELPACDLLYARRLSSNGPSQRLDGGTCGRSTGLSLRGERLVRVTIGSPPGTRFSSQVRVQSVRGGRARVLAAQSSGEESNRFGSPTQSSGSIFVTRTGVHPTPSFVRIDARTGRRTEVVANTTLVGPAARDARTGTFWYVDVPSYRGARCDDPTPVPCRIVRASASPFGSGERTLAPRLTITAPSDHTPAPVYGDPFALSGTLSRPIVRGSTKLRDDPLGGVTLQIQRRVFADDHLHERFVPTDLTTTTGASGAWSMTLTDPPSQPWFSAVTRGGGVPTYAGRGTVGTVQARITLDVAGGTFSGTITPAQAGRTVKVQRLVSRKCQTSVTGERFCNDVWETIANAPGSADGRSYAASVAAPPPGMYTAALPFEDTREDPARYAGRSPEVQVR